MEAQTWAPVVTDTTNQNMAVVLAHVRQTLKQKLLYFLETCQGRDGKWRQQGWEWSPQ